MEIQVIHFDGQPHEFHPVPDIKGPKVHAFSTADPQGFETVQRADKQLM